MKEENIKRILIYTHNSIGIGHAFRIRAVISGIRYKRPDVEFLVLSGTSIPQIFFSEGIELVKLPSVKLDIDREGSPMQPRYLTGIELARIFDFRQRLIVESFDFFQPDVLVIEHNMTGQMNELIPLLMKKSMRKGTSLDFAVVHMCRGIMKWAPFLQNPYQNPRHGSGSIDIGALYDFIYVLDDREVIDVNKQYLGNDPEIDSKIKYLGKITNKAYGELPTRNQALHRIGLPDKKIILVTLGRNLRVFDLSRRLLDIFRKIGIGDDYQVVIVLDPYLDREAARALRNDPIGRDARFLPFLPDMVDLIHHSELVISRAGYNTVNEILLTGAKAMLIPEHHGGGEQELRVQTIPLDNILVASEEDVLGEQAPELVLEILNREKNSCTFNFDKYAIGQSIVEDLETWKASRVRETASPT